MCAKRRRVRRARRPAAPRRTRSRRAGRAPRASRARSLPSPPWASGGASETNVPPLRPRSDMQVAGLHERRERLAQRRARDAELLGELALGRQPGAGLEQAEPDRRAEALDGLLERRRRLRPARRPPRGRRTLHGGDTTPGTCSGLAARSAARRILPLAVFGQLARRSRRCAGTCTARSARLTWSCSSRASASRAAWPSRRTTTARTTEPRSSSGAATTAASATAGWATSADSTSNGPIR